MINSYKKYRPFEGATSVASWGCYLQLMRLDRPIGTLLLLWPTLIALFLAADGLPDYKITLIFVSGVIIMRAAGCVINDYADRTIDPHVSRTKSRPLAAGLITDNQALGLFFILLSIAFVLALQLSFATLCLSIVGAALAIIYPFSKRFTFYPQFILGMAFAWSIPMAYMQIRGNLSLETWGLFCSVLLWVVAYDTQYAMTDKADDLKIGVKSTAIAFGDYDKFIIFSLQLGSLFGFYLLGINPIGLFLVLGLVIYQQWLIRNRDPKACFAAFLNNNYYGLIIFLSVLFTFL